MANTQGLLIPYDGLPINKIQFMAQVAQLTNMYNYEKKKTRMLVSVKIPSVTVKSKATIQGGILGNAWECLFFILISI